MKILGAFGALLMGTFVVIGSAHAATVNTTYSLGDISSDPMGVIGTQTFSKAVGTTGSIALNGFMPADSEVVFTFTLDACGCQSLLDTTKIKANDSYKFSEHHDTFKGNSTDIVTGTSNNSSSNASIHGPHKPSGSPVSLVVASANLTADVGTATFINNTSSLAHFDVLFKVLSKLFGTVTISENIESLSPVPLPASFTLFSMALLSLAGFGYMQKRSRG